MAQLSGTPGVRSIEPAIYSTVLLSAGGRARGVVLKGVDPELELRASEALHHIVAGNGDFAQDADGIPARAGGPDPRERSGYFRRRLHYVDQPAGKLDAFWDVAALAAFPRERNFRFGLLRLRRQLGIRDAGLGAIAGGDWRRRQFAGSARNADGRRARDRRGIIAARGAGIYDLYVDGREPRVVSRA